MRAEREVVRRAEKPRILQFVNTFHLGGTEGQVVELLRGLASDFETSAAAIQVQGAHVATVRDLGIDPVEVPLGGSLASANTLRQIARLVAHLRQTRVGLVHAQDFYTALIGVPAARLAGVKVVVGRLDLGHWLSTAQKLALAAATRAADHAITNAEAIRRRIVEGERLPLSRISVIPNGIDLPRFDAAQRAPLASPIPDLVGRVVIAHVANMVHPVKAQEDLFAAVRVLKARQPQVLVLLVGDGPRRAMLERLASRMGIAGHVRFLGRRSDVPAVLARSHIGVLCSLAEGLSNAIIEGMAAHLPMVVTDAGGNPELIADDVRGIVVPVRAPLALAAGLDTLAASPELRERMGAAGRAHVERELTIEALLRRHAALYRAVLGA